MVLGDLSLELSKSKVAAGIQLPSIRAPSQAQGRRVPLHQCRAVRVLQPTGPCNLGFDIMEDEDHSMQDAILTPGQQALYDFCKHDLLMSRQAHESWPPLLRQLSFSTLELGRSSCRGPGLGMGSNTRGGQTLFGQQ